MTVGTPVIRATDLAKRYRLGTRPRRHQTLQEAVAAMVMGPFRRKTAAPPPAGADTLWALRDVSFEVDQGEVVGVIGRNGAGKSTLLKILARITRPTGGRVEIRGRVGALLEMGTGFNRELTGRENIFLNGVILGMTSREVAGKLDEIVAFAGVERFLDTPVKQYSSGMYIRLGFSVAAHLRPEILLIDEVLAVGDLEFQRKCIGQMEHVAREGRTVVLVSHHLSIIQALCQRALLIDAGRLQRVGPATEVVEAYVASQAVTSADHAVAESDHKDGVREIRLLQVTLVDGVTDQFMVYWRAPIRLRLHVDVLCPLTDVSFGVGVRGLDGLSVFTVHQDDTDGQRWQFAPGEHLIEVEVDNILRPGVYVLHVGADQGGTGMRNILWVETINLEVLAHSCDGITARSTNGGCVNGQSVWQRPTVVGRTEALPIAVEGGRS